MRTCYEAYTVYNFLQYLLAFLETFHGVSATEVLVRSHCRRRASSVDSSVAWDGMIMRGNKEREAESFVARR